MMSLLSCFLLSKLLFRMTCCSIFYTVEVECLLLFTLPDGPVTCAQLDRSVREKLSFPLNFNVRTIPSIHKSLCTLVL